jgi:hypothetical protein
VVAGRWTAVWRVAAVDALRQLARDLFRQAAGHARHVNGELLVQQVGAQVAAGAVEHAGLHGRLAHALDQLAHEQRLELLGRLLDGAGAVLAGLQLERVERAAVGGQALELELDTKIAVRHVRSPPARRSGHRRP